MDRPDRRRSSGSNSRAYAHPPLLERVKREDINSSSPTPAASPSLAVRNVRHRCHEMRGYRCRTQEGARSVRAAFRGTEAAPENSATRTRRAARSEVTVQLANPHTEVDVPGHERVTRLSGSWVLSAPFPSSRDPCTCGREVSWPSKRHRRHGNYAASIMRRVCLSSTGLAVGIREHEPRAIVRGLANRLN